MLVKMIRADDGHAIDVHPSMVADYMTGGYRVADNEIRQEETEAASEAAPVRRRGRKPKVQS